MIEVTRKERFSLKEIAEISGFTLVKTDALIKELKALKILVQPAKLISFRYPAMKQLMIENLSENKTVFPEKIVQYAIKQKDPDLETREILFHNSTKLKNREIMLTTAFKLFDSYNDINVLSRDFNVLMPIGRIIWEQRNILKDINICNLVKVLLSYSNSLIIKGGYTESRKMFDEIFKLSQYCKDRNIEEITFLRKMYFLFNDRKFEEMISVYNKEKKFISKMSELRQTRLQLNIAMNYQQRNLFEKSEKHLKNVLHICEKKIGNNSFDQIRLRCYERLGYQKIMDKDSTNAYTFYSKALAEAEKQKMYDHVALMHSRLAWIAKNNALFETALKHLNKASAVIKKSKITFPRSVISNAFGAYYFSVNDYWKSIMSYHKSYTECIKFDQDIQK